MYNSNHLMYDTVAGILVHTKNLALFHELVDERRRLGYVSGLRLNEFIVLGMYNLDTCGNCDLIVPAIVDLPPVIEKSEWRNLSNIDSLTSHTCMCIAPVNKTCAFCNHEWTMSNVCDVIAESSSEMIEYDQVIKCLGHNSSIAQIKTMVDARHPHSKTFLQETFLQNDKFIDLTNVSKSDKYILHKNSHGWVGKNEGITDAYVMQRDDKVCYETLTYFHKSCYKLKIEIDSKQKFRKMFSDAGLDIGVMISVPNEYCSCERCTDWFVISANGLDFKIGWRKRVIHIECDKVDFEALFAEEKVTKSKHLIHAWGYASATEYLKKISATLS